MTSELKLVQKFFDLFQDLYIHSEPPMDFIEFYLSVERGEDYPRDWFERHTIDLCVQDEIIESHLKGLTRREKKQFYADVLYMGPKANSFPAQTTPEK